MAKAKANCRNCPFCDIITDNEYCKKMVCKKTSKRGKTIIWSMCCYNSNTLKYFSDWVDSHKTPSWCPEKNDNKKTKTRRERNAEIEKKPKHISFSQRRERNAEIEKKPKHRNRKEAKTHLFLTAQREKCRNRKEAKTHLFLTARRACERTPFQPYYLHCRRYRKRRRLVEHHQT